MRLPGYCTECHKFKQVRVSGHGMAMLAARRIASGICSDCQRAEDERRAEAHRRRHA